MHLDTIRADIAAACKDAGRKPDDITLIAVTKNRSVDDIEKLIAAGVSHFGENRVQEAEAKYPALRAKHPHIKLHFIGQLQSNKAGDAVALFDVIHTVDRDGIADALAKEMKKQSRALPCFIQVNTGDEPQKGGVAAGDTEKLLAHAQAQGLNITGLMCIPPTEDLPALHFAFLHKMAVKTGLKNLSMGMSGDFKIAIRFGATHIRVGSALFNGYENNKS